MVFHRRAGKRQAVARHQFVHHLSGLGFWIFDEPETAKAKRRRVEHGAAEVSRVDVAEHDDIILKQLFLRYWKVRQSREVFLNLPRHSEEGQYAVTPSCTASTSGRRR